MKPKPLSPLNHFTVPVAMSFSLASCRNPHCASSHAAALITRVEIDTGERKKRPEGFR
jgi:hypothetical protein